MLAFSPNDVISRGYGIYEYYNAPVFICLIIAVRNNESDILHLMKSGSYQYIIGALHPPCLTGMKPVAPVETKETPELFTS